MARSLKKGPFIDESLMKKIKKLNETNKKEVGLVVQLSSQISLDTQSLFIMEENLYRFI